MDRSASWQELRSRCIALFSDGQARRSEDWAALWTRFVEHPWYRRELKRISRLVLQELPRHRVPHDQLMGATMLRLARRLRRPRSSPGVRLISHDFSSWVRTIITLDCCQAVRSCGQLMAEVTARPGVHLRDERRATLPSIRFHQTLEALDEPHRTVLSLRAAGWTVSEIAEELETSDDVTHLTLVEAIRWLRHALSASP